MSREPFEPDPRRIAQEVGVAGDLVRRADRAFGLDLSEARAWEGLKRRRRRALLFGTLPMAAALAIALGAAGARLRALHQADSVRIEPDPASVAAVERASEPQLQLQFESQSQGRAVLADRIDVVASSRASPPSPASPPSLPSLPSARAPLAPSEARCQRLASAGDAEGAIECFLSLAQGSGVSADVALYWAARISADHSRDPLRTLALLDEHKKRFPDGAMRGEVEWLRVRVLDRLGRFDEALGESERLLATPAGRTLASELHMVRGRIYQDAANDCAHAASEFVALVGEPGPLGDEAELRRAECLEKLGRPGQAAAAYSQYLRRATALHAAKVRERLQSLEAQGIDPEGEP
jgi:hypothetical protein